MINAKEAMATIEELAACRKALAKVDRRLTQEDLTSEEVSIIARKAENMFLGGQEENRLFYGNTISFWDEPFIDPQYEAECNEYLAVMYAATERRMLAKIARQQQGV